MFLQEASFWNLSTAGKVRRLQSREQVMVQWKMNGLSSSEVAPKYASIICCVFYSASVMRLASGAVLTVSVGHKWRKTICKIFSQCLISFPAQARGGWGCLQQLKQLRRSGQIPARRHWCCCWNTANHTHSKSCLGESRKCHFNITTKLGSHNCGPGIEWGLHHEGLVLKGQLARRLQGLLGRCISASLSHLAITLTNGYKYRSVQSVPHFFMIILPALTISEEITEPPGGVNSVIRLLEESWNVNG